MTISTIIYTGIDKSLGPKTSRLLPGPTLIHSMLSATMTTKKKTWWTAGLMAPPVPRSPRPLHLFLVNWPIRLHQNIPNLAANSRNMGGYGNSRGGPWTQSSFGRKIPSWPWWAHPLKSYSPVQQNTTRSTSRLDSSDWQDVHLLGSTHSWA